MIGLWTFVIVFGIEFVIVIFILAIDLIRKVVRMGEYAKKNRPGNTKDTM